MRLALWTAAVGVSLVAQRVLYPGRDVTMGLALYALAVALLIAGTLRFPATKHPIAVAPAGGATDILPRFPALRAGASIALLASGALALTIAMESVARSQSSSLGLPLWLGALACAVLGVLLLSVHSLRLHVTTRGLLELLVVVALVGLAFAFRLPDLGGIPREVHGDEAAVGIAARAVLDGVKNIFGLGWAGIPQLGYVASALSLQLFGNDLFGLRVASAVQGALSVGLLYCVGKDLFSVRVGLLAAVIMAVAQMAVHYSRTGNNYVSALFASLLLFYLLLRGLSTGRTLYFLLAGFAIGLCLSVYFAARLTPVLVVLYCLHRAIGDRGFLRRHWPGLIVMALGGLLFLGPQILVYLNQPAVALGRTQENLVLVPDILNHHFNAYRVSSLPEVLWIQFVRSVGAFNFFGETSMQYGQLAPLLDSASGALFVLGSVLALVNIRHPSFFLLVIWLWLTLLAGSVAMKDAMFSPHFVGALGVMALLPALAIDVGWQLLVARFRTWGRVPAAAIAAVLLVVIGAANYVDYFQTHYNTMMSERFFTVASKYIATVNDRYRVYLLAERLTTLRYDTPRFLIPDVDGVDVRDLPLSLTLDRVPADKGVVFEVRAPKDPRLEAIKAAYPNGAVGVHNNNLGYQEFTSYRVERDDLLAAAPNAYVDHAPIPALDIDKLPR